MNFWKMLLILWRGLLASGAAWKVCKTCALLQVYSFGKLNGLAVTKRPFSAPMPKIQKIHFTRVQTSVCMKKQTPALN